MLKFKHNIQTRQTFSFSDRLKDEPIYTLAADSPIQNIFFYFNINHEKILNISVKINFDVTQVYRSYGIVKYNLNGF